jgi:hypothetical protein
MMRHFFKILFTGHGEIVAGNRLDTASFTADGGDYHISGIILKVIFQVFIVK